MRVHIVRRSLLELSRSKVEIVETVSYINKLRRLYKTFSSVAGRDCDHSYRYCQLRSYQHT